MSIVFLGTSISLTIRRANGAAHNPPATGDEARLQGELGRPSWSGSCACYAAKLSTLSGVEGQRSRDNQRMKAQPMHGPVMAASVAAAITTGLSCVAQPRLLKAHVIWCAADNV